ncbi:MAG: hypothetical protein P8P74_07585 [Crocinitomicaceae bacterium]|nr:hypothetical protein [Crocinitomicaceae bacterium]
MSDGNFTDPSIWNPPGVPTNGAELHINHDVVLNTNIIFNSGELYLGPGGTQTEDGNDRTIWCQSGETLYMNGGTIDCHLLRISEGASTHFYASYFNVDTFWNEKDAVVCPVRINANYLLNDTSAWLICNGINNTVDSIVNLGKLEIGNITTVNTIYNEGELINHFSLVVTEDFHNCNGQGSIAELNNYLSIYVEGDFTNCSDGLINGNGDIYTAVTFLNDGNIIDDQEILSPSGMISGSGNVDSTVFVGVGNCS